NCSMPDVIAVVSKSTRLLISLRNEDCDFSITKDRSTLLFETDGKDPISSIHLQLSTNGDEPKLIQSYKFPCHVGGRVNSVRVDALYPTIFGASDPIESVNLDYHSKPANDYCTMYILQVKLIFDGGLTLPTVTKINSASVNLDSSTVSVSRELLGLSSDFFSTLFYGDFIEKNTGSYNIRECWIFEKCVSSEELTEVAKSCGGHSPHLETFFQFMTMKLSDEKSKIQCNVFEFSVNMHTGEKLPLTFSSCKLVIDVKKAIEESAGISIDKQRLICAGKELEDYKTLKWCKVRKGSILHLVVR
ncbi:hypothetical protein PMAYCL1PPCAC_19961, partial [Pristionchus mayeri]